jgi:hypothetical protein
LPEFFTAFHLFHPQSGGNPVGGEIAAVTLAQILVRPLFSNRAARMLPRLAAVVPMEAKL